MKDTVIKGNGKSKIIKAPSDMPATFDAWRTQLLAGTAYLDVVTNTATTGDNIGLDVVGTNLGKSTTLTDATATALELEQTDPTLNDALYALSQKTTPAVLNVFTFAGSVISATLGDTVLTATADSNGVAVLYPAEFGTWTISGTVSGSALSKTFEIDAIAVFDTTLLPTLQNCTWAQIDTVSQSGYADIAWNIGDTKTFTVNSVSYTAVIIGFNHDTKTAGGLAGITFQMQTCLATTYPMEATDINTNGWTGCVMRSTTMVTLLNQLETALKNVVKPVNKLTSAGNQSATINSTSDSLFLLAEVEIFGAITYAKAGEGSQYAYYAAGNSKIKTVNGSATRWWERSPYGSSATAFCDVGSDGAAGDGGASGSYGVAFGFCI